MQEILVTQLCGINNIVIFSVDQGWTTTFSFVRSWNGKLRNWAERRKDRMTKRWNDRKNLNLRPRVGWFRLPLVKWEMPFRMKDCKNEIKRLKIARMKGSRWKNEMAVGDVTVTNINKTSTFYEFDWKNFKDKFLFLIYQFQTTVNVNKNEIFFSLQNIFFVIKKWDVCHVA